MKAIINFILFQFFILYTQILETATNSLNDINTLNILNTDTIDLDKISEVTKIYEKLNTTMIEYLKILNSHSQILKRIEDDNNSKSIYN